MFEQTKQEQYTPKMNKLLVLMGLTLTPYLMMIAHTPTQDCLLSFHLEKLADNRFQVQMNSDVNWVFPNNITGSAQLTIKVPTQTVVGEQLTIEDLENHIPNVVFFENGRYNAPMEAPEYDYISFGLGTQGTSDILYQIGQTTTLFEFSLGGNYEGVLIELMQQEDPFSPPNSLNANVGQQITTTGYGAADVPICSTNSTVVAGQAIPLNTDVQVEHPTCFGIENGIINLTVSEGYPPYEYLWNTGQTTAQLQELAAGTYQISITDAAHQLVVKNIHLFEPPPIEITAVVSPETCNHQDASIIIDASGGVGQLSYEWQPTLHNSPAIYELNAGIYQVHIVDENDCMFNQSFEVLQECDTVMVDTMSHIACTSFFETQNKIDVLADCETLEPICIHLSPKLLKDSFYLKNNGLDITATVKGCNYERVIAYSLGLLPSLQPTQNYILERWNIHEQYYSGTFESLAQLVDSMNYWDSHSITWQLDEVNKIIYKAQNNIQYGDLKLSHASSGIQVITHIEQQQMPRSSLIELPLGEHFLTLEHQTSACKDSMLVQLTCNEIEDKKEVEKEEPPNNTESKSLIFYQGLSPNGDGQNDVFYIKGIEKYPQSELMVFNRWGITVFKQTGYQNDWSGTYQEKVLPDGIYFYVLLDSKGEKYSGTLNIRR